MGGTKYPEVTRLTFFPSTMLISCRTDSDAIVYCINYHTHYIIISYIHPAERGIVCKDGDLWIVAGIEGDSSTWEYI
jgi:hypothetical protein